MKKLLALLLTCALAFSLAMPLFARQAAPAGQETAAKVEKKEAKAKKKKVKKAAKKEAKKEAKEAKEAEEAPEP